MASVPARTRHASNGRAEKLPVPPAIVKGDDAVPLAAVTGAVLDYVRERREARQESAVLAPP